MKKKKKKTNNLPKVILVLTANTFFPDAGLVYFSDESTFLIAPQVHFTSK